MMDLPEAHMRLSKLAKKWNKDEDVLICWIVAGKMKAHCWYEGLITSENIVRIGDYSYEGWVMPIEDDLAPLQVKENVNLKRFVLLYGHTQSFPVIKLSGVYFMDNVFTITRNNLVILSSEVERMEHKHPALTEEVVKLQYKEVSNEKYLVGVKAIAEYLDCSESSVKTYNKSMKFPTSMQGGRIVALPSGLDIWRGNNPKKKK